MRGRRPEPAAVKEAKGNPGGRPIGAEVEVAELRDGVPEQLTAEDARAVWRELAPELKRLNFLKATDVEPFARYCATVADYWDVAEKVAAEGKVYESESQHGKLKRINPLFVVQERLHKRLLDLEDRFGLSPASRQSIMQRMATLVQPTLPFDKQDEEQAGGDAGADDGSPVGLLN